MCTLFIVWSKKYETGIKILDEQYRGLVSLLNSFFFHRGDAETDIDRILVPTAEMFKAYVKINFLTVEKLMRDSDYPELKKYQEIHEEILSHIMAMDRKYRFHKDAQGFLQFIKDYWIVTVRHHEKKYLNYLLEFYSSKEDVTA